MTLFGSEIYLVRYPETVIEKSFGKTSGELLLDKLCEKVFLSLWSYPNVYSDESRNKNKEGRPVGDGKEICDLLVVFGNHVFIFSDKVCACDTFSEVDWKRWYRRAIKKSARQLYGAEKWIKEHPDRVFIDPQCEKPFPIPIPPLGQMRVHRILVAHGASGACRQYYSGGSGSLALNSDVIGDN